MFAKNMHHHLISFYLIITLFTFVICIRNVNFIDNAKNHDENHHYDRLESGSVNDWIPIIAPMALARERGGNSYYEDNTINALDNNSNTNDINSVSSERGSFAFPAIDINTTPNSYLIDNENANINNKIVRHVPPQYNQDNYYSSRPYPNKQKQPFNSNLNSNLPNVPGYDNYHKTTYQQNYPNYAHNNHGIYLNNIKRPNNYYRRPTPTIPSHQRPNPSYFGGHGGGSPSTTYSQYAQQFSNIFGTLSNLFGGVGSTSPLPTASTNTILQGLEKISRNDDLECVPKVLCQMVGNPQRRDQFPSYITSSGLQSIISALPAASPALVYGRAALLGITGGVKACSTTYSKCPQEEEEVLYYLNNHRGGFFKFFNEPGGSPYRPLQNTTESPLGLLMSLLSGNTNSGVASIMGSAGTTLGDLFGNVLQGLTGGNTMHYARSRNRRDAERRILTIKETREQKEREDDESNKANNSECKDSPEARILNKFNIEASRQNNEQSNFVKFPYEEEDGLRYGRLFDPFKEHSDETTYNQDTQEVFKFPKNQRHVRHDKENPNNHPGNKIVFPENENLKRNQFRFGKILNRHNTSNYHSNNISNYNNSFNRRPYYSRRDYGTSINDYLQMTRYKTNRTKQKHYDDDNNEFEGNIYVTNSQGVVEYYVNKQGKKVYL